MKKYGVKRERCNELLYTKNYAKKPSTRKSLLGVVALI